MACVANVLSHLCLISLLPFMFIKKSLQNNTVTDITTLNWEVWCKLQPNGFDCENVGTQSRFYYDLKLQDCRTADFGKKCLHNINNFDTITECHEACIDFGQHEMHEIMAPSIYCRLQPDFGYCNGYYPRFYFDVTKRECRGFSYSGCGGNMNRFSSYQLCSAVCKPVVEYNIDGDNKNAA